MPQIQQNLLISAMEPLINQLSLEDKQRNEHGKCKVYKHDTSNPHHVESTLPMHFGDIHDCTARYDDSYWLKKGCLQVTARYGDYWLKKIVCK